MTPQAPAATVPRHHARVAVAAALDAAYCLVLGATWLSWVAGPPSADVVAFTSVAWLAASAVPLTGSIIGFAAYAGPSEGSYRVFRAYMLASSILATAVMAAAVALAAFLWNAGFADGDFATAGLLGLSLLFAAFSVLPVPVSWASFALAASGLSALRREASGQNPVCADS